jgi:hypothetical protein
MTSRHQERRRETTIRKILLAVAVMAAAFGSVGFAIGSSGIAPWRHTTPSYSCDGYQGAAFCRLRRSPYEAFVTKGRISIVFQGSTIFSCVSTYGDPYNDCIDYR